MITAIKSILIYICSLFIFLPSGILFIVTSFILPTHLMYKSARIVSWLMLKSLFVKLEIDGDIPSPGVGYICLIIQVSLMYFYSLT